MGVNKNLVCTDGLNASVQVDDILVGVPVAASGTLALGTPICRDLTQVYGMPQDVPPSKLFVNARVGDRGVLATSANAGDLIGVFQGVSGGAYKNSGSVQAIAEVKCAFQGVARVLAGAVASGTAVTIGANLIISSSNIFATVGSRAIGTSVGKVMAYPINTTVAANIASGSQTVTVASILGITTSTQLTIDSGTLQEVVTPSAVSGSTFTATFANAHTGPVTVQGINNTIGATIIAVPGSSNTQGVVLADLNGIA
jgi:hypothetical protein